MHKKISCIVPVYNVSKYLRRCLDSLINQTIPTTDYEIILVDDGSTDDSGSICDEYSYEYDFISVIHQKNKGPAAARNAGLQAACGDYISFADPDDYVSERFFEIPYAHAMQYGADIVIFDAYKDMIRDRNGREAVKTQMNPHAKYGFCTEEADDIQSMRCQILYPYMAASVYDFKFYKNVPLAAPWDKLYRAEFLRSNNLKFPENLRVLDDMCFNFEAFGKAKVVSYVPSFLYHYQVVNSSITNSYRPDRPQQDIKAFWHLYEMINEKSEVQENRQIKRQNLQNQEISADEEKKEAQMTALYARVIKSFAICCRLCFFNKEKKESRKEQLSTACRYMELEPYKTAFEKISLRDLEWKLKIVAVVGRLKKPWMLYLLHKLQNG
ncbi:glycosyltransferase [Butyrivibrio sp. INlla14]|uniref:glycosyltransferase n=1 Tax=Butyrivibrio sp. INlla14 TaxID=1520808 RepID=UPI00087753A6|nr:glycosyltransferase family 2 protein [Butyrivibrio sp. INlla14]SCY45803.1 Glycosyltransferase involved in cell wall bisynthesis [Butyrivibrio sp. INlla14]